MFSGIIEATSQAIKTIQGDQVLNLYMSRPDFFDDLNIGDSLAVNGICLTVEALEEESIKFAVAYETLQITGWNTKNILEQHFNLERSLKLNGRMHGHFVMGHVDTVGQIDRIEKKGESLIVWIEIPAEFVHQIWPKGSIAINGVSLTINEVKQNQLSVCLIPETLRRTNLKHADEGQKVNVETDFLAKAVSRQLQLQGDLKVEHNSRTH